MSKFNVFVIFVWRKRKHRNRMYFYFIFAALLNLWRTLWMPCTWPMRAWPNECEKAKCPNYVKQSPALENENEVKLMEMAAFEMPFHLLKNWDNKCVKCCLRLFYKIHSLFTSSNICRAFDLLKAFLWFSIEHHRCTCTYCVVYST